MNPDSRRFTHRWELRVDGGKAKVIAQTLCVSCQERGTSCQLVAPDSRPNSCCPSLKLTRAAYYRILRRVARSPFSSPLVRRHLIRKVLITAYWDSSHSSAAPVSADCSSNCSDRSSAINRLRQIIPERRERCNLLSVITSPSYQNRTYSLGDDPG